MSGNWHLPPVADAHPLACRLGIAPLWAALLLGRGYGEEEALRLLVDEVPPSGLPGLEDAASRIREAMAQGQRIRVYGDYDVDGITASVLLAGVLRRLGARADIYIPHRLEEGYGLNREAVLQAAREGIGCLVTVDCGSTAVEEVALGREAGMAVIVTDHHQISHRLPEADGLLSPRLPGTPEEEQGLAGVGVAFRLAQAVAGAPLWEELDLVALGTIADVAPLLGVNRPLVRRGLTRLGEHHRPGVQALLEEARATAPISSSDVAFGMAPRLNAAGRLATAHLAVDLLEAGDLPTARRIARQLSRQNRERQAQEAALVAEALPAAERQAAEGAAALFLYGRGWHRGLLGIAASRLVERFHLPVLLATEEEGLLHGSGRSLPGFHLEACLQEAGDRFQRLGGHAMAVGFTLPLSEQPFVHGHLSAAVEAFRQRGGETAPPRLVDARIRLADLTPAVLSDLQRLEPMGQGFPPPLLLLEGVAVQDSRPLGKGGDHRRLLLAQEGMSTAGLAFRVPEEGRVALSGPFLDVLATPGRSGDSLEILLRDWRQAAAVEPLHLAAWLTGQPEPLPGGEGENGSVLPAAPFLPEGLRWQVVLSHREGERLLREEGGMLLSATLPPPLLRELLQKGLAQGIRNWLAPHLPPGGLLPDPGAWQVVFRRRPWYPEEWEEALALGTSRVTAEVPPDGETLLEAYWEERLPSRETLLAAYRRLVAGEGPPRIGGFPYMRPILEELGLWDPRRECVLPHRQRRSLEESPTYDRLRRQRERVREGARLWAGEAAREAAASHESGSPPAISDTMNR